MVNRILSLQLVFTLAASQAWAISGGPYDGQLRLASMSGTYGVSLNGANDDHLSTTGVMLLSVPTRGLAVAKTLIFDQGLMYAGTSTGAVKLSDGGGSATMITQLTHYVVRTVSDGTSGSTQTYADRSMSGVLKLAMAPDYFTGITKVTGSGQFWEKSIRLTSSESVTTTITDTDGVSTKTETTTIGANGKDATDSGTVDATIITDPTKLDGTAQDGYQKPALLVLADGLLQSSGVSTIVNFAQPSDASNWGVDIKDTGAAPATGNTE
ncbi:MAG: hypothetical protein WCO60_15050 [Verrucomicrobiota bacterium]